MTKQISIHFLLARIALAVVFLGFGVWEILDPTNWTRLVPSYVSFLGNPETLITIHGTILVICALIFLWGRYVRYAAIVGSILLLQIVSGFAMGGLKNPTLIRDTGILLFLISMIFYPNENKTPTNPQM